MLAASPLLRKPEQPANTGSTVQRSPRYGSHPTSTQSPNHQNAFAFTPANTSTSQSCSPRVARPSASYNVVSNYHEASGHHSTEGCSGRAMTSSSTGQSQSMEGSAAGLQGAIVRNVSGATTQRPDARHETQSPSIKRRQPATPPTNTSTAAGAATAWPLKRSKTEKKESKVLPAQYELCAVEDIVILIADMIAELIQTNDNLPLQDGVLTRFHSRLVPSTAEHQNLLTNVARRQGSRSLTIFRD